MPARLLAAALTPLTGGGRAPDLDAARGYVDFLAAGGVDGIFALGTTGEGILLEPDERRAVTEAFRAATAGRLELVVHAGALTTAQTVALAEHAAAVGADGIAAIAPPYFAYSETELLEHLAAAAAACAPVPFYAYEYAARSGYALPVPVLERLRERAPNLVGLKTSDTPLEAVTPYMLGDLDVLVGYEPMIPEALAAGAAGAVSGLAAVFPDAVAELVRAPSAEGSRRVEELRARIGSILQGGKAELARRGLMRPDVRAPLLPLG